MSNKTAGQKGATFPVRVLSRRWLAPRRRAGAPVSMKDLESGIRTGYLTFED
jgi:hypothetical protein